MWNNETGNMKIDLEHMDKTIAECRRAVECGEESQESLDKILRFRAFLELNSEGQVEGLFDLVDHLPEEGEDAVLIVLKGHLLIEKQVRRFVASHMRNPRAFDKVLFSAAQSIALGEALCPEDVDSKWMWGRVRKLNAIRNQLAHSFPEEGMNEKIRSFIDSIHERQDLKNKTLKGAISRIYTMLLGLNKKTEGGGEADIFGGISLSTDDTDGHRSN